MIMICVSRHTVLYYTHLLVNAWLDTEVVNAETNVGIVFENDFGGAHILYRPQLEELLGNGQQLGSQDTLSAEDQCQFDKFETAS